MRIKALSIGVAVAAVVSCIVSPAIAEDLSNDLSQEDMVALKEVGPGIAEIMELSAIVKYCRQGHIESAADNDVARKIQTWSSDALSTNMDNLKKRLNTSRKGKIAYIMISQAAGVAYKRLVNTFTLEQLCVPAALTDIRSSI